jgi:nicotinamidase-related amidase
MPGSPWAETPLGLALSKTGRTSLLLCGYWLDECITFTALNALGEGYDIFLLTDASPPLDAAERHMAILRLVQAGIVPTSTRQALREWSAEIADAHRRDELLALI